MKIKNDSINWDNISNRQASLTKDEIKTVMPSLDSFLLTQRVKTVLSNANQVMVDIGDDAQDCSKPWWSDKLKNILSLNSCDNKNILPQNNNLINMLRITADNSFDKNILII